MSEYYQFRDETGTPIDYYELVNDNNEFCKENEQLKSQLQQKENIIKEVREILCDLKQEIFDGTRSKYVDKALEVLDKVGDNNE